jgi:hypothetical protein
LALAVQVQQQLQLERVALIQSFQVLHQRQVAAVVHAVQMLMV